MSANDEPNEVIEGITPGTWKWVFVSTAGRWFLLGNNGEGPIVKMVPDTPDGNLIQAAPALMAALTEPLQDTLTAGPDFATDLEHDATILELHGYNVRADALRVKAQAIRAAIAAVHPERSRRAKGEVNDGH